MSTSITKTLTIGSPPSTDTVNSLSELQSALADSATDITIGAQIVAPRGGINFPRLSSGRVIRCGANGMILRGSPYGLVVRSDGTGGALTLIEMKVDGGWRSDMRRLTDDESNMRLQGYSFLRLDRCVSAYSKRTGLDCTGTDRLEVVNSVFFANARDCVWEQGVRDYLADGNIYQHSGDDGWGTHFSKNQPTRGTTRSIIMRNCIVRDCYGAKGHGGASSGFYKDKLSQVLIEDNVFEAAGCYGVNFLYDPNNNEPVCPPENIIIQRNTFRDVTTMAEMAGGQRIGICVNLEFPDHSFSADAPCIIRSNTFVRNRESVGQTLQSRYSWAALGDENKPAGTWGGGEFEGFFHASGFRPAAKFRMDNTRAVWLVGGNKSAVLHSGNLYQGDFYNILT